MRILHVVATLSPQSGGPAIAALDMAKASARLGNRVTIFSTNFAPGVGIDRTMPLDRPVTIDGVTVRYFAVRRPLFWRPSSAMARALTTDIGDYDVVHLHSLYLFHSWFAARAARRAGVPYIVRPHGTLDPYILARRRVGKWVMDRLFQRRTLRQAAAIHFTAEAERALAAPVVGSVPGFVVPLGVGQDAFKPASPHLAIERWPALRGKRILLFLGRLHPKKGLDLLLPAFARLAAEDADLHLLVAGPDDGALSGAQVQIRELALADKVTLTGMLSGDLKWSAFAASDLFVLPSRSENFGIAVGEALATGLPVVISDQVNIWSDLADSTVAAICTCDVGSIERTIRLALDRGMVRAGGQEQARQLAAKLFGWDSVARKMDEMYATVIANARQARP